MRCCPRPVVARPVVALLVVALLVVALLVVALLVVALLVVALLVVDCNRWPAHGFCPPPSTERLGYLFSRVIHALRPSASGDHAPGYRGLP
jgi:hypothetical protein